MVNGGTLLFHASPLRGERIFGRALARKVEVRRYSADTPNNPRQASGALMKVDMNTLNSLCKYYNFILFVAKNVNIPRVLIPSPEFLSSLTFSKKFCPLPQGAKE